MWRSSCQLYFSLEKKESEFIFWQITDKNKKQDRFFFGLRLLTHHIVALSIFYTLQLIIVQS